MKNFLRGTVAIAVLGLVSPVGAADLAARPFTKAPAYVAAGYDWGGFYIGANGGWASSRTCWDFVGVPGVPLPVVPEGCHHADGGVVGGQIGYNFQAGAFVFGLEAQGDWADLKGSNDPAAFPGTTNRTRIDALGLFTGRVGYAWNSALLYLKGGAAVVHDRYDFGLTGGAPLASTDETRWGGTVGAGPEYGFAPNWSVGVEYDHVFLDRRDATFGPSLLSAAGVVESIGQNLDMVTARINYRWAAPSLRSTDPLNGSICAAKAFALFARMQRPQPTTG